MKRKFKKVFAVLLAVMMMATLGMTFFVSAAGDTGDTADVAVSAINTALDELTATISIGNIITIVVSVIGASILLVFFWWGLRKIIRAVMNAFRKGKLSV